MLKKEPILNVKRDQNASMENWMEQIAPFIADLNINDIMIPGSHDSGCYNAAFFLVIAWVKTQDYSIQQQLKSGVRYFDLRFAYFPGNSTDEFWIAHDTWNTEVTLKRIMQDINAFLEKNPKEIVILKLSHFRDFDNDAHLKFTSRFTNDSQLGRFMVPKRIGVDEKVNENKLVISQLWNSNKRLITVTDDDQLKALSNSFKAGKLSSLKYNELKSILWSEDCMTSKWCNTLDTKELKDKCTEVIKSPHRFLWALELILTPDTEYVVKHYLTGGSVEKLAQQVNPLIKQWLSLNPEWRDNVNLFVVDFYQSADWVKIAINANKKRLAKKIGDMITQSETKPDQAMNEDVMLKTMSLFDLVTDSHLIKIGANIKSKDGVDQSHFLKRLQFYQFLYESKFSDEQNEKKLADLCSAIYLNIIARNDCSVDVENAASTYLRSLMQKHSIDISSLAIAVFQSIYHPKVDYEFKAPRIGYNIRVQSSADRKEAAVNKLTEMFDIDKAEAIEWFENNRNDWMQKNDVKTLSRESAEQIREKILSRILALNNKVGFFGGEEVMFQNQKLLLPKSAFSMLNQYVQLLNKPEQFIEACINIANKALKKNRGSFLNWRQDESQEFYQWVSKIHVPEEVKIHQTALQAR